MIDQTIEPVRLLGLTGSLRRDSYSTAILRTLKTELVGRGCLEIRNLRLPLYNEDEDQAGGPADVLALRNAIANADGLVISTPEYNHGVPGVLKNALDWASRPSGRSVLSRKPTLVISNSPAFTGGVRAHAQLNGSLLSADALIAPGRQVVLGGIASKICHGLFVDMAYLSFALDAVVRLVDLCGRAKGSYEPLRRC